MNYWQNILSSNYQHALYEIVFVKFRRIVANFTWRFFCLQAETNASDIAIDWIIPHALNDGYSVSILELWHVYCVSGGFCSCWRSWPCSELLFLFVSLAISCAGYYYYYCLSDNHQWLGTMIDKEGGLPLGQVFWRGRVTISGIIRTCICCSSGLWVLYLPFCTQV